MLDEDNNYYINGTEIIELTDRETELLSILLRNKIIKYSDINRYNIQIYRITICRLRKKLKGKLIIKTINKVGYIIK